MALFLMKRDVSISIIKIDVTKYRNSLYILEYSLIHSRIARIAKNITNNKKSMEAKSLHLRWMYSICLTHNAICPNVPKASEKAWFLKKK